MNKTFPLVKIENNFNKEESSKIFNKIMREIKKEKNDDFPYNLAYQEQLEINYCIKNSKVFNLINIFIFAAVLVKII
jgi:hypothetical protein